MPGIDEASATALVNNTYVKKLNRNTPNSVDHGDAGAKQWRDMLVRGEVTSDEFVRRVNEAPETVSVVRSTIEVVTGRIATDTEIAQYQNRLRDANTSVADIASELAQATGNQAAIGINVTLKAPTTAEATIAAEAGNTAAASSSGTETASSAAANTSTSTTSASASTATDNNTASATTSNTEAKSAESSKSEVKTMLLQAVVQNLLTQNAEAEETPLVGGLSNIGGIPLDKAEQGLLGSMLSGIPQADQLNSSLVPGFSTESVLGDLKGFNDSLKQYGTSLFDSNFSAKYNQILKLQSQQTAAKAARQSQQNSVKDILAALTGTGAGKQKASAADTTSALSGLLGGAGSSGGDKDPMSLLNSLLKR